MQTDVHPKEYNLVSDDLAIHVQDTLLSVPDLPCDKIGPEERDHDPGS